MKDFKKELQMEYTDMFGNTYQVLPKLNTYANNGNLYVGLDFYESEDGFWEPYSDVTVNIVKLSYLESAIDINNNGANVVNFLVKNGFGELTEKVLPSGFCAFPVFKFNAEKLKEIDPVFFKEYAKSYGVSFDERQPLTELISKAEEEKDEWVDVGDKHFVDFLDDSMEK